MLAEVHKEAITSFSLQSDPTIVDELGSATSRSLLTPSVMLLLRLHLVFLQPSQVYVVCVVNPTALGNRVPQLPPTTL